MNYQCTIFYEWLYLFRSQQKTGEIFMNFWFCCLIGLPPSIFFSRYMYWYFLWMAQVIAFGTVCGGYLSSKYLGQPPGQITNYSQSLYSTSINKAGVFPAHPKMYLYHLQNSHTPSHSGQCKCRGGRTIKRGLPSKMSNFSLPQLVVLVSSLL